METARAIDCHAHVFSATASAIAGARYRPTYAAKLAEWQARWPAAGITHGVLVQPSFFGVDNHEMLAALAADSARLRGIAVIDAATSDAEIGRLHAAGVRGIRWNLRGVEDLSPYASREWSTALARVASHGWHLEAFVDRGRLPRVIEMLQASRIDVVFDHFGNPGVDAATANAAFDAAQRFCDGSRLVYVKLSGAYRVGADARSLAQRWLALDAFPVWGSDWPWTQHEGGKDYARLRADLETWLDGASPAAILWDNPARLYDFDRSSDFD